MSFERKNVPVGVGTFRGSSLVPDAQSSQADAQGQGFPQPATGAIASEGLQMQLYLHRIDQEMIRPSGLESMAGCTIFLKWKKVCCILDFGRTTRLGDSVQRFMMRKEDVGGLIWHLKTGAVYKLNEAAYHAAINLEAGFRDEVVAERVAASVSDVATFRTEMERLQLL